MIKTIKKRDDFIQANKQGKHWFTKAFIIQALQHCDQTDDLILTNRDDLTIQAHRFGFTATKKLGNAVKRNFAKRRLRALIREEHALFDRIAKESGIYHFVLVARHQIFDYDYAAMKKDLKWALKKLDLIHHEKR